MFVIVSLLKKSRYQIINKGGNLIFGIKSLCQVFIYMLLFVEWSIYNLCNVHCVHVSLDLEGTGSCIKHYLFGLVFDMNKQSTATGPCRLFMHVTIHNTGIILLKNLYGSTASTLILSKNIMLDHLPVLPTFCTTILLITAANFVTISITNLCLSI